MSTSDSIMPAVRHTTSPTGRAVRFHQHAGHITSVRVDFGQWTRTDETKEHADGTHIEFDTWQHAYDYLEALGLEDHHKDLVRTLPGWSGLRKRARIHAACLQSSLTDVCLQHGHGPDKPDPELPPAPAPATWHDRYHVSPEQDPDTGRWAFHVFLKHDDGRDCERLTTRGYDRASLAERVTEMRWKLQLDEPNSASARYLRHHFTDTLHVLEG